jgi:hypothetical protein
MDAPAAQPPPGDRTVRSRTLAPFAIDAAAWALGLLTAVVARYELQVTTRQVAAVLGAVLVAVCAHAAFGYAGIRYRGRHGFGTFEEVRSLSATVLATSTLILVGDLLFEP